MAFRLSSLATHHLRSVDKEKKGARLRCKSLPNNCFAASSRAEQQHSTRRLHPDALEQLRMFERHLNQLAQQMELLLETSNVVVTNFGTVCRVLFTIECISLRIDDGFRGDDTVLRLFIVNLHNLEINSLVQLFNTNGENLSDMQRSVIFKEVWLEKYLKHITSKRTKGVLERKNVHALCVLDVRKLGNFDSIITDFNSESFGHHSRQRDGIFLQFFIRNDNTAGFLSASTLDQNRVTVEKSKLLHSN
mmetsp:Transcript_2773/g.5971  ORF Transcript_2773/g.5971 Transcript_2773/m.5971 type:complete len:248 (+) Transcript_2773:1827-2570(+)